MSNSIALLALEAADGTVVLTSITLVFAMLVALCLIITVEGRPCSARCTGRTEHRQGCSCRPRSTRC